MKKTFNAGRAVARSGIRAMNAVPSLRDRRRAIGLLTAGMWGLANDLLSPRIAFAQGAQSGPFKTRVTTFALRPAKPRAGQRVQVIMRIETNGAGRKSVPWEILVNNKRIGGGVHRSVPGGRRLQSVATWIAAPGLHNFLGKADPRNSLKESSRDRKDNARGFSITIAGQAATQPSRTQSSQRQTQTRRRAAPPFTVQADRLRVNPTNPQAGQTVSIKLRIRTSGSGSKSVPWEIKRGNVKLASGVKKNVSAGSTFEVSANWKATTGAHTITGEADPKNTLGETTSNRSNNKLSKAVGVEPAPDWPAWGAAAWDAAKYAVNLWKLQARFRNIKISAVSAIGKPGCLTGPRLKSNMKTQMMARGVPNDVADAWAGAVSDAWKVWQDNVTVPGLPWYPAFAAFPGPQAPPMPNVPMSLTMLPSSRLSEVTTNKLKTRIKGKLGSAASQPGADPAITQFTNKFKVAFTTWLASQQVQNVLGKGPVPVFAPPYVPAGPVVNGSVISQPGHLVTGQFGAPF